MREASSKNPESSILIGENVYIKVHWFVLSNDLKLEHSNLQSIVNTNGMLQHVYNNTNKETRETAQEVAFLKKEIEYLKQSLKDKEEIIALLKEKLEKG